MQRDAAQPLFRLERGSRESRRSLHWIACIVQAGLVVAAHAGPLDDAAIGERVTIPGFAYADGKRIATDVALKRIDVYAPDAKLYAVGADGVTEVPRSPLRMFVSDPAVTASRLFIAYDARRGTFTGGVADGGGLYTIEGTVDKHGGLRVERSGSPYARDTTFECGSDPLHMTPPALRIQKSHVHAAAQAKGVLRTATIAIDTDNELMQARFGNSTSEATAFIAEMFAAMNFFFERDLDVTLQQGTTFLRVAPDPYPSTAATGMSDQLDEFATHWRTQPSLTAADGTPVVPRTFAALLSGKSGDPNRAVGVAWLLDQGTWCAETGAPQGEGRTFGHYSVTRVFTNLAYGGGVSANLVGHEIGHNFGALHTHCSSRATGTGPASADTIDQCYNREPGCYSDAPMCPFDNSEIGRGSVMSYCHFPTQLGGPGCGPTLNEFHPVHQAFLRERVQDNVAVGCVRAPGVASTDLSAAKTSATTSAAAGDTVGYTITIANAGPDAATGVQLTDPTPQGLVFASASGGGCTAFPCTLGTLASGTQIAVTATYTIDGSAVPGTTITNVATVSAATGDPIPMNDSGEHAIAIESPFLLFRDGFE